MGTLICSIQEALPLVWIFALEIQVQTGVSAAGNKKPSPNSTAVLNWLSQRETHCWQPPFTTSEGQSVPYQFPFSLHNCFSHWKNTFYYSASVWSPYSSCHGFIFSSNLLTCPLLSSSSVSFYQERFPKCVCVCAYRRDADFSLTAIPSC